MNEKCKVERLEDDECKPISGSSPTPEEWNTMAREYEREALARANMKIIEAIVPRECDASTKYYRTKLKSEK